MKAYGVRQKSTGFFIPRFKRNEKSGTALEPSDKLEPRLFFNKRSATSFLGNWLQGIMHNAGHQASDGEWEAGLEVVKQPHRNKEDMEIVEFDLIEVKNVET